MRKIAVKTEGMMCPMCESHICDVIRKSFPVHKVTASRRTGEAVILADEPVSHEALKRAVDSTGYRVLQVSEEHWQKRRLFHRS
ncbi:heavy-metal-associated domain-containing protein [Faecalibaculum rodentium]|uniref:heavy-metal-associated domain-containing protein n=1 Tax=Faecalibaculum rodentium TaxID=1702221 RepID=UPI00272F2AC3|nr:heavy metal-associated domain-containing protein [Faecalibaculum rodentium]